MRKTPCNPRSKLGEYLYVPFSHIPRRWSSRRAALVMALLAAVAVLSRVRKQRQHSSRLGHHAARRRRPSPAPPISGRSRRHGQPVQRQPGRHQQRRRRRSRHEHGAPASPSPIPSPGRRASASLAARTPDEATGTTQTNTVTLCALVGGPTTQVFITPMSGFVDAIVQAQLKLKTNPTAADFTAASPPPTP